MRRLPYALALLGVAVLVAGLAIAGAARSAQRDWRATLSRDAEAQASSFGAALDRAGSLALLLAQSDTLTSGLDTRSELDRASLRLEYLWVLYSYEVEEASILDQRGRELLRVVDGTPVPTRDLRDDVAQHPWFQPAMELLPGEVYQGPPHRSTSSGQWVISTTTWIPHGRADGGRLVVHFELQVDGFSRFFAAAPDRHTGLVDGAGGHVVLQDGRRALHHDDTTEARWSHDLVQGRLEDQAVVESGGDPLALARVRALEQGS